MTPVPEHSADTIADAAFYHQKMERDDDANSIVPDVAGVKQRIIESLRKETPARRGGQGNDRKELSEFPL